MKSHTLILAGTLCFAVLAPAQQVSETDTRNDPALSTSSIAGSTTAPVAERFDIDRKLRLYLHDTFGLAAAGKAVLFGAVAPAHGSSGNWGVGPDARADRIQSALAEHVARHTIEFAGDAALHLDSRYHRTQSGEFGARFRHALASTMLVKTDSGATSFAIPRVGAAYGGAFLSNLWYPQGHNSWQDAATRGTGYLGWIACKNVAREFWPDIERRLRRPRARNDQGR